MYLEYHPKQIYALLSPLKLIDLRRVKPCLGWNCKVMR